MNWTQDYTVTELKSVMSDAERLQSGLLHEAYTLELNRMCLFHQKALRDKESDEVQIRYSQGYLAAMSDAKVVLGQVKERVKRALARATKES